MTEEEIMAIVRRAQEYDLANRLKGHSWTRVPDHQVIRLLIGAGMITVDDR